MNSINPNPNLLQRSRQFSFKVDILEDWTPEMRINKKNLSVGVISLLYN